MSPEALVGDFVAARLAAHGGRGPLVVGLCGAQGSGKSTIAAALARRFPRAATLSLDDLYLTRADRLAMARDIHPLFATRGVPGTHDLALGHHILDELARGAPVPLPRFDKARDDRAPKADWDTAPESCELLVLEGWCVGARAQPEAALAAPVNALERDEDPEAIWRSASNAALAGPYQAFFARLDALVLLAAPGFETVFGWRQQQEAALRAVEPGPAVMDDAALVRFVAHYERLTRHILAEMPARADLVVPLTAGRGLAMAIDSSAFRTVTSDV